jgi:hypothetical protein
MTYTELQAAICDYTQNFDQDFVSNIPVFVQQAEQRIFNTVQFPSIRKNVMGVTSTNNKYLSCPDDFLAVYSLAVVDALGNYEFLLNKDVNFIRQPYLDRDSQVLRIVWPNDNKCGSPGNHGRADVYPWPNAKRGVQRRAALLLLPRVAFSRGRWPHLAG